LLIIIVVAVVGIGGVTIWTKTAAGHDSRQTNAAAQELQSSYRGIDLAQLQRSYNASAMAGTPARIAGLPATRLSRWMWLNFKGANVLVAEYRITGTNLDTCVGVTVSGPAPNRVTVAKARCHY
jgi:hypothetical protein